MTTIIRNKGETITIGNAVTITVIGVDGDVVRLGVNAPEELSIHRLEVYERFHMLEALLLTERK